MTNEIIEAVVNMLRGLKLYAAVTLGPLPAGNGVSVAPDNGAVETDFFDRSTVKSLPLIFNAKHEKPERALAALDAIHRALTRAEAYPEAAGWQILTIKTESSPGYLGKEDDRRTLYGSSVTVRYLER